MKKIILTLILLSAIVFSYTTVSEAVQVDEYSVSSDPMYPGDNNVYLQITLVNTKKGTIEDVDLTMSFGDNFEAIQDTYNIAKMGSTERHTAIFKFNVKEGIDPGAYDTTLKVSYKDASGSGYNSFTEKIQLGVATEQRIEILNLKNTVESGVYDTISFDLKNVGQLQLSNLEVYLNLNFSYATPKSDIYLSNLAPGETKHVEFEVFVDRDVSNGVYPMDILVDAAQGLTGQTVGILIAGKPLLKVAGVSSANDIIFMGQEFSISVQLENIGTGDARSAVAEIMTPLIFGNRKAFVGTIDSDDTESAVYDLTSFNLGYNEVELKITYLDDQYNEYEQMLTATYDIKFDFGPIITVLILAGLGYGIYYFIQNKKVIMAKLRKMI